MEFIEKQIEKAKKTETSSSESPPQYTELVRKEDEPLKLDIKLQSKPKTDTPLIKPKSSSSALKRNTESEIYGSEENIFKKPKPSTSSSSRSSTSNNNNRSEKKTALDEIIRLEEKTKEKKNRKDYWLAEGIVVKFISKSLGEKYYKKKGVILEVVDKYQGKMKFYDTGDKVKVDQVCIFG